MNNTIISYAAALHRAAAAAAAAEEGLMGSPPLSPEILAHAAAVSLLATAWATIALAAATATKP